MCFVLVRSDDWELDFDVLSLVLVLFRRCEWGRH